MQQCILSFNNRAEVLELPVPLQEWSMGDPQNTYRFTTMETGEVLAIGSDNLDTMEIESFFPAYPYSFLYSQDFEDPWTCVETIKRWKHSKRPIRVIIVGTDVNHAMAIEGFEYGKGDNTKDVSFTLSLVEYRFLNTERSTDAKPSNDEELKDRQDEAGAKEETTHTVKSGDTLWDLAERHLGGVQNWERIAQANGVTDPRALQIGTVLRIPGGGSVRGDIK